MDAPLFHTALVTDSKIAQITDDLAFAVYQGASSNTFQQFTAVSNSNSNLTFNVQIPSESVVINREVLINATMTITLTIGGTATGFVPIGQQAFNYGVTDAFQAFPISKSFSTTTATINNSNVSTNTQDILDVLLRMNSSRELLRYSGMTPSFPDSQYAQYSSGYLTNNNPLASYNTASYDIDQVPRGSFPLASGSQIYRYVNGIQLDNNPVAQVGNATEQWKVVLAIDATEPIFCSPFIFGEPDFNKSGLAGINTINLVMNIDGSLKRVFSTMAGLATNATAYSVSVAGGNTTGLGSNASNTTIFTSPQLLMNFLSTQPTQLVPSRVVTPYIDYPRYISSGTSQQPIVSGASATLNSQNIQLNQLPDYFFIVVRPSMSSQTITNSASFLTINSISINLNNVSGILASSTQEDLWKMSIGNHSTQSWLEFSGLASQNDNTTGLGDVVGTTGSILVLSPALNLSLSNMLSNSSIGQFNFQFSINVTNNLGIDLNGTTNPLPEILVVTANSGMFVTSMGSSSIFTGLLTKQLVLDASEKQSEDPIQSSMMSRLVGGKMGNMPTSAIKHLIGKNGMRRVGGTAYSGGADSGGRMSKLSKLCM
jgi:hypothetical protein|nr:MAG: putative major capsid protein [Lake Baikal virophage 10]